MEPIELILLAGVIYAVKLADRWARKLMGSKSKMARALGHDVDDACSSVETVVKK